MVFFLVEKVFIDVHFVVVLSVVADDLWLKRTTCDFLLLLKFLKLCSLLIFDTVICEVVEKFILVALFAICSPG